MDMFITLFVVIVSQVYVYIQTYTTFCIFSLSQSWKQKTNNKDKHKTKLRISSIGKDVEQLEFSFTASGW